MISQEVLNFIQLFAHPPSLYSGSVFSLRGPFLKLTWADVFFLSNMSLHLFN